MPVVAGFSAVAAITALYTQWLGITNPTIVALSFLLVVLVLATVSTRTAAIATSLMAMIFFNYFFLPPVGTLTIADPSNWVALFTLLAVSIVASHLSTQVRERAREATARRDELARLFELTRDILLTSDTDGAIALISTYVARRFGLRSVNICLPDSAGWHFHRSGDRVRELDTAALDRCLASARARLEFDAHQRTYAGHVSLGTASDSAVWLVPLRVGTHAIGVLALEGGDLEPGTRDAIAGVTAIAIERSELLEERNEAEVVRRGAELKSALLASLGHDLRTPLTAVTVAANNLDASWLTPEQRHEQAEIVRIELTRLNRLFQDIVDMARIETHAVASEPEWVEPAEIVSASVQQVERALANRTVHVDNGVERAFVRLDPRLTSAALAHVLENAAQYSPPGSIITIALAHVAGDLRIAVHDQGPGIAPQDAEHLFERFYRGAVARQQRFGTGMGLAITRGLLAAEGGRVRAENDPRGGALFTISVPVEARAVTGVEKEAL